MVSRREFFFKILYGNRIKETSRFLPSLPYNTNRELFYSVCFECQGECIVACNNVFKDTNRFGIIKKDGNIPYIDFGINGCLFCKECAKACPNDVLNEDVESNFNFKVEIDILSCLAHNKTMCYACKDMCYSILGDKGAIEFLGIFYPKINNTCISCGFCISVCPTNSIVLKEISE